jgi:hypothetical protein
MLTEKLYNEIFAELLQESISRNSIMDAINNRWVCRLWYNDGTKKAAKGYRDVEIFAYGRTIKGHDAIRVWQRSGASRTPNGNGKDHLRNIEGWRLFRVDRIAQIEFLRNLGQFDTDREKFDPDETGTTSMAEVYHAVDGSSGSAPATSNDTRTPVSPVGKSGEVDTRLNKQAPAPASLGSSIKSGVKSGVSTIKSKLGGLLDRMKNRNEPDKPKRNIYEATDNSEGEEFINRVLQDYL